MTTPQDRWAARVLLVDADDRVLLFRGADPAVPDVPYWFTPGGGIDPGETPAQGAARELFEETGLALTAQAMGEPVHDEVTYFTFDRVDFRQEQRFFLVRVPGWEVSTAGFDAIERDSIDRYQWWSVAELRETTEVFYPRDLADVLERVL